MSDVSLNSPDPTPRPVSGEQRPARASSSPPAEGSRKTSSAEQARPTNKPVQLAQTGKSQAEAAQKQAKEFREDLDSAVTQLNDFVQSVQRDLEFEVDEQAGRTVVRVIDQQTDEVIRQIPDEIALRLAENLQQDEPISLFNIRV